MSKYGKPTKKNIGKNIVRKFPHPTGKFGTEDWPLNPSTSCHASPSV